MPRIRTQFFLRNSFTRVSGAPPNDLQKCILELCDKIPSGTKPFVLIDGNFTPPGLSHVDAECVIGGDGLEFCIAAASIIAKVTRDRMMVSRETGMQFSLEMSGVAQGLV